MSIIPFNFSYQPANSNAVVSGNDLQFIGVSPKSGSTFQPMDTVSFHLSSSSQFVNLSTSFLSYDVQFVSTGAPSVNDNCLITSTGLASVIKKIETRISNLPVESISDYNSLLALVYPTISQEQQNILALTESVNVPGLLQGQSSATKYHCSHPIRSGYFQNYKSTPLCVLRGGIDLDIQLSALSDIVANVGTVGQVIQNYVISNIQLIARYETPQPGYVSSMLKSLESGKIIEIPFNQVCSFRSTTLNSNHQNIDVNVSSISSLNDIMVAFRSASTGDLLNQWNSQSLVNYCFKNGTKIVPQGRAFNASDSLLIALSTSHASLDSARSMNVLANYNNASFRLYHSFTANCNAEAFGDGLSVEDGHVTIETNHSAVLPAGVQIFAFASIDCKLLISKDMIKLAKIF